MPAIAHTIILYGLVTLGVIASTLWLLYQWRQRWFDDDRLPPQDEWRRWR